MDGQDARRKSRDQWEQRVLIIILEGLFFTVLMACFYNYEKGTPVLISLVPIWKKGEGNLFYECGEHEIR